MKKNLEENEVERVLWSSIEVQSLCMNSTTFATFVLAAITRPTKNISKVLVFLVTQHSDDCDCVKHKHHPGYRIVHSDILALDSEGAHHADYSSSEEGQKKPAKRVP